MGWTLITGSAKRLGASIARTLAKAGFPVVIHFHQSEQEAEDVVTDCREFGVAAEKISGDFSSPDTIENFIGRYKTRFPDTDNLINNVGDFDATPSLSMPHDRWQQLFQSNLFAPVALTQQLLPAIKKAPGSIINIGMAGVNTLRAYPYATAYQAAKTALWLLTKTWGLELAVVVISLPTSL